MTLYLEIIVISLGNAINKYESNINIEIKLVPFNLNENGKLKNLLKRIPRCNLGLKCILNIFIEEYKLFDGQ